MQLGKRDYLECGGQSLKPSYVSGRLPLPSYLIPFLPLPNPVPHATQTAGLQPEEQVFLFLERWGDWLVPGCSWSSSQPGAPWASRGAVQVARFLLFIVHTSVYSSLKPTIFPLVLPCRPLCHASEAMHHQTLAGRLRLLLPSAPVCRTWVRGHLLLEVGLAFQDEAGHLLF